MAWRPVFINNGGTYYLTDLIIYADGILNCWGSVPFATFVEKGPDRMGSHSDQRGSVWKRPPSRYLEIRGAVDHWR